MLTFRITHEESGGRARVGVLTTARSEVATPAFMPVGSLGNVRSVDGEELLKMGYGLILNNAYHLYLRPGHKSGGGVGRGAWVYGMARRYSDR
jgi:queuine tRNA-ribosyltransferase